MDRFLPVAFLHGFQSSLTGGCRDDELRVAAVFAAVSRIIWPPAAVGTTAIAEWEARFDDLVQDCRKLIRAVAILEFEGNRIAHLREYRTSERLDS